MCVPVLPGIVAVPLHGCLQQPKQSVLVAWQQEMEEHARRFRTAPVTWHSLDEGRYVTSATGDLCSLEAVSQSWTSACLACWHAHPVLPLLTAFSPQPTRHRVLTCCCAHMQISPRRPSTPAASCIPRRALHAWRSAGCTLRSTVLHPCRPAGRGVERGDVDDAARAAVHRPRAGARAAAPHGRAPR